MSHLYSFSFFPNPNWSRRWAGGKEIFDYINQFVKKFNLEKKIRYNCSVVSAHYDDNEFWTIKTDSNHLITCRYFIVATGQNNTPKFPPNLMFDKFKGRYFHAARWPDNIDLKGKVVAVVGNAASAVQLIPEVATVAKKLFVIQRSPNWIFPKGNKQYSAEEIKKFKSSPEKLKAERKSIRKLCDDFWDSLLLSSKKQKFARKFAIDYMKSQLKNPRLRRLLIPKFPLGVKRVLYTDHYLNTFNRENVELINDEIQSLSKHSVSFKKNKSIEVDILVFATGFSATNFISTIEVTGRFGLSLRRFWNDPNNVEAYLGTFVHGFPNMFLVFGPNSGLGTGSIVDMIEAQAKLIANVLSHLRKNNLKQVEVVKDVQDQFNLMIQDKMKEVVWSSDKAVSWYKTEEGKVTTKWPFPVEKFEKLCGKLRPREFEFK